MPNIHHDNNGTFSTTPNYGPYVFGVGAEEYLFASLGIKVWHVCGMIIIILLGTLIAYCSCVPCRLPRTRKEIELDRRIAEITKNYANDLLRQMEEEKAAQFDVP